MRFKYTVFGSTSSASGNSGLPAFASFIISCCKLVKLQANRSNPVRNPSHIPLACSAFKHLPLDLLPDVLLCCNRLVHETAHIVPWGVVKVKGILVSDN